MGSKWRKAKLALGVKLCVYVPRTGDDDGDSTSGASLLSPLVSPETPSPSGSRLSKSISRTSKNTCSICLATMKCDDGHAIFTAECSHSFHFQCIASNVKHSNQICPVCRAKWKEIPLQGGPVLSQNNALMTVIRRAPTRSISNRHVSPVFQALEPAVFDDEESLDHQPELVSRNSSKTNTTDNDFQWTTKIQTYPEVPAVSRCNSYDDFTVLIHLKAPVSISGLNLNRNETNSPQISQTTRAPVDLVTVLDNSGSMAGTKLALLKRAMGFVIQNLGPNDRLSVIAFSSTARRLFPLRRMSETGRQQALQAVNSLAANGGTNIAEGLRKGAKVMEDRKEKNPVSSIILLSDGQDTYTVTGSNQKEPNYQLLIPLAIHGNDNAGFKTPVHAFGFGTDHDASLMHSISEISGGTFSFIETEDVMQDAFAQCIGGLLSVVVKELQVYIECVHPSLCIGSLRAGSYPNCVMTDRRMGSINVGDLYADEERDFLVSVNVPVDISSNETSLIKVRCVYNDPLTKETVNLSSEEVGIKRPEIAGQEMTSMEVDRQRNRVQAAEAMAQARSAAEQGDLTGAVSILESFRNKLSETVSAKSHDRLCVGLDAELKEMQERMTSRHVYEASGRAYILSGLSSHLWQRATARGDCMDGSSYQTPSMTKMVNQSRVTLLSSPSTQRLVGAARPFASQPKPR
ncbi:E3 ubiquitin-protein ligase WAV3-like [Actinidia eriantha]|uniref:E3 ubiquitin-protein ligase WAV3-like n=1 Tax=Actinidia eriantha TaxID=165200 RepID=UPI00258C7A48|nr:E3 ubiquitin-protein ligase WAV3-like [Actinidia eriantha]